MTIGLAIVLAAVLFLIDRNHIWAQAWKYAKIAVLVGIVLGVLVFGGLYAWVEWEEHLREEQAQSVAAQQSDPYYVQHHPYDANHREPAFWEDIDCYDGFTLLPDKFASIHGSRIVACGPHEIPRPRTERANLPVAELQHVERIEACYKQLDGAKIQACSETK
jgi:hypothetical protein